MRRIVLLLACWLSQEAASSPHNKAEDCSPLDAIAPNFQVDFYVEVQPLLQQRCGVCHTDLSLGGFNVLPNNAKLNLLGEDETGAPSGYPDFRRVVPGSPRQSLVFLRINCANAGTPASIIPRMPPGSTPTGIDLQALMNDWIATGAILRGTTPLNSTDRQFLGNFEAIR